MARPRGTDIARVILVIETKALRGSGTDDDPVRIVIQYWDFDGNLLAENDCYGRVEEKQRCNMELGQK